MDTPRRIDDLADELISGILSCLLSSESAYNPRDSCHGSNGSSRTAYGEKTELDRFRLVCRRFMRIGTPQMFPLFVLRFSRDGFQRLEDLLHMQLACHVKYFTYMVRPFYQGSGWSHALTAVESENRPVAQVHYRRLHDQKYIVDRNQDLALLRGAIAAFPALKQVKLLRLQDEADEQLLGYLRDQSLEENARLDWEPACTRAVTSLGVSLLESKRTEVNFVAPQISPEATVRLLQTPPTMLSALGARLTSLDVTFHAHTDMTTSMETLSHVFYEFFLAAKNLTAIHLGFPANLPLDLSLDRIFHRLQWRRLHTLSIQGWRLGSDEIIALIRRHRRPLRDLRLASVYLRAGGRWCDILSVLHDEMDLLERIDLSEINYAADFDAENYHNHALLNGNGHGDGGFDGPLLSVVAQPSPDLPPPQTADYLSFAPRGNTRRSFPDATLEKLRLLTADDLGDNGVRVHRKQRSFWEQWVLSSSRNIIRRRD
ncbi:F-box domain protein [Aspergillus affinis]|uniref:F-box domain protein n=1 Tax=Aspergillus affinis TaxID=1070780 RepID=UPI0022FE4691|nr:F-box domain protein [Aspergillus affinis]KAI9042629.1 F-box domain protein [Aspergillus affinis]